ncbi:MAG: heavy metal translocating P-type ATPase [Eubacteriales bacterium]|nr:heavy metal translocating P-type ATPase [Eubacteriales bacterium]
MDNNFVVETPCTSAGCSHGHGHDHDHESNSKYAVPLLLAGGVTLAAAIYFRNTAPLVGLALFVLSYILTGGDVVLKAVKNIAKGEIFDENFLMVIATFGAFLIGEYPEAVAVMIFYKIGEAFQDRAIDNSKKSIKALMDIKPDYANLFENGQEKIVSPATVEPGSIILVKPGEKIPLDGIITEGNSSLDTSALTGESKLREVYPGDEILSGSVNTNGLLKVQTTKTFSQSAVNKIIELVQHAGNKKADTEKFITKFARYYTPAVVALAVVIALVPPFIIPGAEFYDWIYRALVFLVISCPCALVISIPLGFFAGIGAASRKGILVKGGNYLEALNYVDTVIFDKTGTLTKGTFAITSVISDKDFTEKEILEFAAIAESHSSHPIAKSIKEAWGKEISSERIKEYSEIAGQGVMVKTEEETIYLGNEKLGKLQGLEEINVIEGENIDTDSVSVYLWINKRFAGQIILSDVIREESAATVTGLKSFGIKDIIMLTGDEKFTAEKVAKKLGISKVFSQLLPQEKLEILESNLQTKGKNQKTVFIGDGINDAPVLARADIGIAMGGIGSDAAVEAADIVFMKDNPASLLDALKVAKDTKKIVWQNIVLALGIKVVIMTFGIAGLAGMWEAVFADVGVALIAILNSVRILK